MKNKDKRENVDEIDIPISFPKDIREFPITYHTREVVECEINKWNKLLEYLNTVDKEYLTKNNYWSNIVIPLSLLIHQHNSALNEIFNLKLLLQEANPDLFEKYTQKDYGLFVFANQWYNLQRFDNKKYTLKDSLKYCLNLFSHDKYFNNILIDEEKSHQLYNSYLRWRNKIKEK